MRIAINARFSGLECIEGYGRFTNGLVGAWQHVNAGDDLLLMYDRPPVHPNPSATKEWKKGPMARHPLLWKVWYDLSLPSMVRESKADILFSPDGFCSLTTSVPQVLAIHDLAFLHYPEGISGMYRWFYQYYTPSFIRKANHIITVSEFSKQDILQHYPQAEGKISVIYNAADPGFRPLEWGEKERVREELTNGHDYFLYAGSIHPRKNLMNLLKGFSWFKNRHRSGLKLVLAGRIAWGMENFSALLKQYKYRDDVLLMGYVPDQTMHRLMASAYALVYPSFWEGFGLPLIEAMQCGVPVICSSSGSLPEISGGAGIHCSPEDPEAFGKAMGLLYKDEGHRAERIQLGLQRATDFSWEDSARKLRGVMGKIVGLTD